MNDEIDVVGWRRMAETPSLEEGDVFVWRVGLGVGEGEECAARALLSPDEAARCDRFKFAHLRRRYAVARAALRRILGTVLGMAPESVRFEYGVHDKPALAGTDGGVVFNVSHSGDLALIAVGRCAELGVDVEYMKRERACREIAVRFFAHEEIEAMDAMRGDAYVRAFYRCWTRKEAFVKARGGGLSIALSSFAVSVDDRARLVRLDGCAEPEREWRLFSLEPAASFAACVAARGAKRVACWDWAGDR